MNAALRAVAQTGRIEFESGLFEAEELACVVRITAEGEDWPPISLQLKEGDRFELLAFFEDIAQDTDLPYPAITPCGWPGFPLSFVGSNPGDGSDVSLRVTGAWTQPSHEARETELQVPLTRLREFWPALARVMHWPGYRD